MKQFGLIGHPLGHSFSARYFAEKFGRGIPARYDNYDLADIQEVEGLRALCGFNVTIPYKQAIIPFLAGMSAEAAAIGAVNTVRVEEGRFYGFNTDVIGFRDSLRAFMAEHQEINVTGALVLGTGGASLAVCYALKQLGITAQSVSRTKKSTCISYDEVEEALTSGRFQLIVNCTPLGTTPNENTCPPISYEALHAGVMLYDLVYNPAETLFLRRGRLAGCPTKNGLEMLHLQAEAAWQIWTREDK